MEKKTSGCRIIGSASPQSSPRRALVSRYITLVIVSGLLATSCIYERPPGDEFYRTLWKSDDVPLGPFSINTLTLEFLCNNEVSIRFNHGYTIFGTYDSDGTTATLHGLSAYFGNNWVLINDIPHEEDDTVTITFIEAHRDGETLFLLWRVQNAVYPFTTALHRLSEYED